MLLAKDLATKIYTVSWFNFNGYWLFSLEPQLKDRQPYKLSLFEQKTEFGWVYTYLWWRGGGTTTLNHNYVSLASQCQLRPHFLPEFGFICLLKAILLRRRADVHLIILNTTNVKTIVSFSSMFDTAAITTCKYFSLQQRYIHSTQCLLPCFLISPLFIITSNIFTNKTR